MTSKSLIPFIVSAATIALMTASSVACTVARKSGLSSSFGSMFIERVSSSPGRIFPAGRVTFTDREKEVLEMLVAGRSNKEIGAALGIEERTVKAHVAKLMRKVGVQNRIALSVHAITHSLVTAK